MKLKNTKTYGTSADKSMQTWMQLLKVVNKIGSKESTYIKSFDLTMSQFKVLEVLYHRGDLSIGSITKLTLSTPGNITVVVRNLKKDGFISSISDTKDKRASILSITKKGSDLIAELFPNHASNLKSYFDILNDEELESLFYLLRKLYKAQ